jgi:hypothetical protein
MTGQAKQVEPERQATPESQNDSVTTIVPENVDENEIVALVYQLGKIEAVHRFTRDEDWFRAEQELKARIAQTAAACLAARGRFPSPNHRWNFAKYHQQKTRPMFQDRMKWPLFKQQI